MEYNRLKTIILNSPQRLKVGAVKLQSGHNQPSSFREKALEKFLSHPLIKRKIENKEIELIFESFRKSKDEEFISEEKEELLEEKPKKKKKKRKKKLETVNEQL